MSIHSDIQVQLSNINSMLDFAYSYLPQEDIPRYSVEHRRAWAFPYAVNRNTAESVRGSAYRYEKQVGIFKTQREVSCFLDGLELGIKEGRAIQE